MDSYADWQKARELIPGGVNSPARSFAGHDRPPPFIERGEAARVYDSEGNEYVDYVNSWGALVLGHAHPEVTEKLKRAVDRGTSFGAPTGLETQLGELIVEAYSAIDKVRLVNSGTEATMSALRLCRGYTGRDKVIKMEGCYHGHGDSFLVDAGSGPATLGQPDSPGVPVSVSRDTISVPYNDKQAVELAFKRHGSEVAGLILEPVAGNMGVVPPAEGYLQFLREITREHDSLLIFDEVITGFRVAYGGCQELFGVAPDLVCLGKIIGGGMPVGAYGGSEEVMRKVAPEGPVYQAGTLSGNPLATTAGIATLEILSRKGTYEKLSQKTNRLVDEMREICEEQGLEARFNVMPGMFSQFFTSEPVVDYTSAAATDEQLFNRYFELMLEKGIYLAPSRFESSFVSLAHDESSLSRTLNAYGEVIEQLVRETT